MKLTIHLLACLFICFQGHAQKGYVWSEVNPSWKTLAIDYWKKAGGFSSKTRDEMIAIINRDNLEINQSLIKNLVNNLNDQNIFKLTEATDNPIQIQPEKNDFYIDLELQILSQYDVYPYFKKGFAKYEPEVIYDITVYSGNGIMSSFQVRKKIDYKTKIKPNLPGNQYDYEKIISEYKLVLSQAAIETVNDIPDKIKAVVNNPTGNPGSQVLVKSINMGKGIDSLFRSRKKQYPEHYAALSLSKTQITPIRSVTKENVTPVDDKVAYGSADVANSYLDGLVKIKNYALVLAVNDYQDPKINDLNNPIDDAKRLLEVLTTHYTFEPSSITFIVNPGRNDIILALDEFAKKITIKDNFLIFYAGHGIYDAQLKKGYWLPKDAREANRSNWFSNSDLRDYIGGINSKHTLLIADACFSGGIFKTRDAFTGASQATVELNKLTSRKAITSGAMNAVPDKSVFIDYLIKRLRENDKPVLASESLFASFKEAVINNSPNGQVPQFGEIRETGDEGGDFLFIRKK